MVPISKTATDGANKLLEAIQLTADKKLSLPSLILIYSTIDIMASLGRPFRPAPKEGVNREDFRNWVDSYMLPGSGLLCTSWDLYAARCGIVHSMMAESDLSRKGKAHRVLYAWGDRDEKELRQLLVEFPDYSDAVAVHLSTLIGALREGIRRFLSKAEQDDSLGALVNERAEKLFVNLEIEP